MEPKIDNRPEVAGESHAEGQRVHDHEEVEEGNTMGTLWNEEGSLTMYSRDALLMKDGEVVWYSSPWSTSKKKCMDRILDNKRKGYTVKALGEWEEEDVDLSDYNFLWEVEANAEPE